MPADIAVVQTGDGPEYEILLARVGDSVLIEFPNGSLMLPLPTAVAFARGLWHVALRMPDLLDSAHGDLGL